MAAAPDSQAYFLQALHPAVTAQLVAPTPQAVYLCPGAAPPEAGMAALWDGGPAAALPPASLQQLQLGQQQAYLDPSAAYAYACAAQQPAGQWPAYVATGHPLMAPAPLQPAAHHPLAPIQPAAAQPAPAGPLYVNQKQLACILRRRSRRQQLAVENKLPRTRKPYLHKGLHEVAKARPRGSGGKFLSTAEVAEREWREAILAERADARLAGERQAEQQQQAGQAADRQGAGAEQKDGLQEPPPL